MKLPVILGAMVSLTVSGVAQAALLDSIHGGVRINRGNGYVAVRDAIEAKTGDSIMAAAKGRARLVYSDGCVVDIQPGSVAVVVTESPCAKGATNNEGVGTEAELSTTGMVVSGLALAAVAGGIASAASNGQHTSPPFIPPSPASP
jgi:hypothetical protein